MEIMSALNFYLLLIVVSAVVSALRRAWALLGLREDCSLSTLRTEMGHSFWTGLLEGIVFPLWALLLPFVGIAYYFRQCWSWYRSLPDQFEQDYAEEECEDLSELD